MSTRQFQDTAVGKALIAATDCAQIFCIVTCAIYLFCLMGVSTEKIKEIWTSEEIRLLSVHASIITLVFVTARSLSVDNGLSPAYWCGSFAGIILSVGVILYNSETISILGNNEATRFIFHLAFLIAALKAGQIIGTAIWDTKNTAKEQS